MHTYCHHVAGRWRARYPQIKNQPARARATQAALQRIKGVTAVETNTVTGSVLIHYDPHHPNRAALMQALQEAKRELGLGPALSSANTVQHAQNITLTDQLTDKLLGMAVEKCIERSAMALLAALI